MPDELSGEESNEEMLVLFAALVERRGEGETVRGAGVEDAEDGLECECGK